MDSDDEFNSLSELAPTLDAIFNLAHQAAAQRINADRSHAEVRSKDEVQVQIELPLNS
jgi:hypothetical protein